MSQRDQFEIIRNLLEETYLNAPDDWTDLMLTYYVEEGHSATVNSAVVGTGAGAREVSFRPAPNMDLLMRELRDELAQAGRPPFTHCKIRVTSEGQYEATYRYGPVDWESLAIPKWNFFPDQKPLKKAGEHKIYLITVDSSGEYAYPYVENLTPLAMDGLVTMNGGSLAGKFPDLTYSLSDGDGVPPGLVDYFSDGIVHVVSANLRSVLESAEADFEYFPVTVLYENMRTPIAYFAANPLKLIAGIDLQNSKVEFNPILGDCMSVEKFAVDESKFDGVMAAALMEIPYIAVQKELARKIELSGALGIDFIDPASVQF